MATVAAQRLQAMPREVGARPQLSSREHLITVLLAAWMTAGIFIDGWAHINLTPLETFFTPWHAVFYSGFLQLRAGSRMRRSASSLDRGPLTALPFRPAIWWACSASCCSA